MLKILDEWQNALALQPQLAEAYKTWGNAITYFPMRQIKYSLILASFWFQGHKARITTVSKISILAS